MLTDNPSEFAVQAVVVARVAFRALIAVCVAAITIALASEPNLYEQVIKELDALVKVNIRSLMYESVLRNAKAVGHLDGLDFLARQHDLRFDALYPRSNALELDPEFMDFSALPLDRIYGLFSQPDFAVSIVQS